MKLQEILQHFGVPCRRVGEHHHATEGWVQADCPQCSPGSGRFRLGFSLRTGAASCWTCGPVGTVDSLAQLTGQHWREIKLLLSPTVARDEPRPRGKLVEPEGVGELQQAHLYYLRSRGLDPYECERLWGVQGIGLDGGFLKWRLYLPVTSGGRTVSWTTRSISDKVRSRYLSARPDQESVPHKDLLYGEDLARHSIVVVEGPLDAMRIGPGAVATFGVAVSKAQLGRISRHPVRAICFDNEPLAQRRAEQLAQMLSRLPGKTLTITLDGKDPASSSRKEINRVRKLFLD